MILLAIIFFALAALGCSLLIGQVGATTWARVMLIVALPALAFAVWQAAQPPTGWPAHAKPARDAAFMWASIREPSKDDRGEIDLWLLPAGASHPRSYRQPYSRQLHEQAQAAMRAVKRGVRVGIRKVANRGSAHSSSRSKFVLYVLPPPAVPSKD